MGILLPQGFTIGGCEYPCKRVVGGCEYPCRGVVGECVYPSRGEVQAIGGTVVYCVSIVHYLEV